MVNLIVPRKGIGDLLAEGSRRATRELNIENLIEGLVSQTGFSGGGHDPRLYPSMLPIYATEPILSVAQIHEITHSDHGVDEMDDQRRNAGLHDNEKAQECSQNILG